MSFSKLSSSRLFVASILILIVVGLLGVLVVTNTISVFHKKPASLTTGSSFNTKGQQSSVQPNQNSGSINPNNTQASTNNQIASNLTLYTPTGSFVSNHRPNLSGYPAPNLESSVCTTTPGADCTINFTMDNTTRSLDTRTTDSNGSAYWDWKLQDINLTAGTWKIQAVAKMNGQTKTASDAIDLMVAQ